MVDAPAGLAVFDEEFPAARSRVYLDNASTHPLPLSSAAQVKRMVDWEVEEVDDPWWPGWAEGGLAELRGRFARLVGVDPSEVFFTRSTVEAENDFLNGLVLEDGKRTFVTSDLNYAMSVAGYLERERRGASVRVVRSRDWRLDPEDFAAAIDDSTALVSVALVSNVNGAVMDVPEIARIAHDHGALLFLDIMQGVGAMPIDLRALGADLAACSGFKWMMGLRGFGFGYVRDALQGVRVRPSRPGGGVTYPYEPWSTAEDPGGPVLVPGEAAARWECAYPNYEGAIAALTSLKLLEAAGVTEIRRYSDDLISHAIAGLSGLGYRPIRPEEDSSPIVAFVCEDPVATWDNLRRAGVSAALRFDRLLRIAPTVFNSHEHIDALVAALARG